MPSDHQTESTCQEVADRIGASREWVRYTAEKLGMRIKRTGVRGDRKFTKKQVEQLRKKVPVYGKEKAQ